MKKEVEWRIYPTFQPPKCFKCEGPLCSFNNLERGEISLGNSRFSSSLLNTKPTTLLNKKMGWCWKREKWVLGRHSIYQPLLTIRWNFRVCGRLPWNAICWARAVRDSRHQLRIFLVSLLEHLVGYCWKQSSGLDDLVLRQLLWIFFYFKIRLSLIISLKSQWQ